MIVYSATKEQFHRDVLTNAIEDIVHGAYYKATGRYAALSEVRSWANSLEHMERVLSTDAIAPDSGVAIEYHLPRSSKRIDFILTGRAGDRRETVVIINLSELKQLESAAVTELDEVVTTVVGGGHRELPHPSYQAWSYQRMLEATNATVEQDGIGLNSIQNQGVTKCDTSARHEFCP